MSLNSSLLDAKRGNTNQKFRSVLQRGVHQNKTKHTQQSLPFATYIYCTALPNAVQNIEAHYSTLQRIPVHSSAGNTAAANDGIAIATVL